MTITREIWRKMWLESINELTFLELQRSKWLDPNNENPHLSYVEFMCSYFDDILTDFSYKHYINIDWLTQDEYDIIKVWHNALNDYKSPKGDAYDNEAILADNKWLHIVEMGLAAKQKLSELLPKAERNILTGL